jgi:predicted short-subunit dehydrogenase-like oxidoreductase (DUF2520 family)
MPTVLNDCPTNETAVLVVHPSRGSVDALTGPVVRGDETIIARHLADIDQKMPEFSDLYRLLGQHTLEIARNRPDFPKAADQGLADQFKKSAL